MSTQSEDEHLNHYLVPSKRNWSLFLISIISLFLEMLLIRWIGTEIRIFAYLQNTILVACFLGLGIGYFTSHQLISLRQSLIPLVFLLLLMAIPVSRDLLGRTSEFLSVLSDLVIWGKIYIANDIWDKLIFVILGLILTYSILILVVDIFVPIGRLLARLMDEHPHTIRAYSVNIAGSLVGTWLFVLLSSFYQPPGIWFVVFAGLMLFLVVWSSRDIKLNLVLIGSIVLLANIAGIVPGALDVIWSPYQKLVVEEASTPNQVGDYLVTVNNAGYQVIIDLSNTNTTSNPERYPPELNGFSQYDIPLLLHPDPQTYLIVGAGAGNDAAGGIRQGVKRITAVEIDPAIIAMGQDLHPEQPYASPVVEVVNDDARSFFSTTNQKFDVISFGLLDSHTTTAMTNARLDHYVYTKESISRAKSLLAEGGIMVLTFEPRKHYIADRIASVLRDTFGEEPIVFRIPYNQYGWGGVTFITGDLDSVKSQMLHNERLGTYIRQLQKEYPISLSYTTKVTTDDWPYIYLSDSKIPALYYLLAGLMLVVFIRTAVKWKATNFITRWNRSHWHFCFLGLAFLLLEVQNISKASVILGNTWETSAVIVSGVLIMLLVSNWIARRFPRLPIAPVYAALIGISIALYFVDLAQFAVLPRIPKMVVVGILSCLPMLFSGIIFVRSFAIAERKDEALGANIIGSIVGALIQSVTFIVGIKALLLIVTGMYLLSMLTKPQKLN